MSRVLQLITIDFKQVSKSRGQSTQHETRHGPTQQLSVGLIPGRKIGHAWVASKRELAEALQGSGPAVARPDLAGERSPVKSAGRRRPLEHHPD